MRPREQRETGEQDLFRSRLDQIIDLTHALVRQSYARVGKPALIKHQRYAHAHQFKRQPKPAQTQDLSGASSATSGDASTCRYDRSSLERRSVRDACRRSAGQSL